MPLSRFTLGRGPFGYLQSAASTGSVSEQSFFHASGIGSAFGQSGYFQNQAPERVPLALTRFAAEAERTVAVLYEILAQSVFMAIADIAHFGWFWRRDFAGIDLSQRPNVARWYAIVSAGHAVARASSRVNARYCVGKFYYI